MGESAILFSVCAVQEIPNLIHRLAIGVHEFGELAPIPGDTFNGDIVPMKRQRGNSQCALVRAGDCLQVLPGLRQCNRLAACLAVVDPGAVLYADHDRVPLVRSGGREAKRSRLGKSECEPHVSGTRVEWTIRIEFPNRVEQLLSVPVLQPDELDGALWPREHLAANM